MAVRDEEKTLSSTSLSINTDFIHLLCQKNKYVMFMQWVNHYPQLCYVTLIWLKVVGLVLISPARLLDDSGGFLWWAAFLDVNFTLLTAYWFTYLSVVCLQDINLHTYIYPEVNMQSLTNEIFSLQCNFFLSFFWGNLNHDENTQMPLFSVFVDLGQLFCFFK